jgi:hypothetical protein
MAKDTTIRVDIIWCTRHTHAHYRCLFNCTAQMFDTKRTI